MMEATELHRNLAHFSGCDEPTRHRLAPTLIFTQGICYLREHADCHWLVDAIASYYSTGKVQKLGQKDDLFARMQIWFLKKTETGAVLEARADTNTKPLITQEIEYTDFPFPVDGVFKLYVCETMLHGGKPGFHLMLPSEY